MAEETPASVEQLVNDGSDVWNGDFSKLDLFSESFRYVSPATPDGVAGRDEFEAFVRGFREGFPDLHVTMDEVIGGDELVVAEWTANGTHEGEYNDVPPTGREIEFRGIVKLLIEDGAFQEGRNYYDQHDMLVQLGLVDA